MLPPTSTHWRREMGRSPVTNVLTLLQTLVLLPCLTAAAADATPTITLAASCPPGFELIDGNRCALRSLYQQYQATPANTLAQKNAGVGGLRTPLPPAREHFSPQQIDLGRYLFFDPILSRDGSIACASCHDPDRGFTDGKAQATGIDGQSTTRSAPSLWNVTFLRRLFWDARAGSLEEQVQGPLYAHNEMDTTPAQLVKKLNSIDSYRRLFAQAFVASPDSIALDEIYTALAAFESSLVSLNSRYDQYAHGYHDALTQNEIEGMNVFRSFVARCAECHTPPLFTNQQIAVIGTPEPGGRPLDAGAQIPTGDKTQRGGFRVPSLRNIALTAPYMHSGRFATLREAVEFYTLGRGHAVPKGENLALHWHIWEPQLTSDEIDRVVDFLQTLTDERFKPPIPQHLPSGLTPVSSRLAITGIEDDPHAHD